MNERGSESSGALAGRQRTPDVARDVSRAAVLFWTFLVEEVGLFNSLKLGD